MKPNQLTDQAMFRYLKKLSRNICERMWKVQGTPHQIAMGVSIGMYIAFLPIPGFQMLLAGTLALAFRVNKVLSMSFVWISNALTAIPIFMFNYVLGCCVLRRVSNPRMLWEVMMRLSSRITIAEKMNIMRTLADRILLPLWAGSMIAATVFSLCGYIVVRCVIKYTTTSI